MNEVFELVGNQGVVVVAFVWLLKYTLDTSKEREDKLMNFMMGLQGELKNLSEATIKIAEDMEDVKSEIRDMKSENK